MTAPFDLSIVQFGALGSFTAGMALPLTGLVAMMVLDVVLSRGVDRARPIA